MRTNKDRTHSARLALNARCAKAGTGNSEENVIDLLADLIHYCDRRKIDFDHALTTARAHHEFETGILING